VAVAAFEVNAAHPVLGCRGANVQPDSFNDSSFFEVGAAVRVRFPPPFEKNGVGMRTQSLPRRPPLLALPTGSLGLWQEPAKSSKSISVAGRCVRAVEPWSCGRIADKSGGSKKDLD
jgi:hypothetical protein